MLTEAKECVDQTITWINLIPDWLTALGTILALLFSAMVLLIQRNDRNEELKNQEYNQVRRVNAWCKNESNSLGRSVLFVQNLNDDPVYHLVVRVGKFDVDFQQPSEEGNAYAEYVWGNLGPQMREDRVISSELVIGSQFPDIPSVEIEFTDCNGCHWKRDSMGKLEKIESRRPYD